MKKEAKISLSRPKFFGQKMGIGNILQGEKIGVFALLVENIYVNFRV
jgi:hypothetical protein